MLTAFAPDLWLAAGPETRTAGFAYPTRMAVVRLADGALWIWSPVALTPALQAAVDALGSVRHIIAPNALHHLFIGEWQCAYPAAQCHAAPGLRARRPDLGIDSDLGDTAPPAWAGAIDHCAMRGNRITTEIVFFHRASGTALFTDLIQHFDRGWFRGWRGVIARLDLLTAPAPTVPRKFRLAFTDRRAARVALGRILAWPIERLVMAHGPTLGQGGHAAVVKAFDWLRD